MRNISIIGTGRLGLALAYALDRAGISPSGLFYHRHFPEIDAEFEPLASRIHPLKEFHDADGLVIIAVSDPAIRTVAELISSKLSGRSIVLHTSGARTSNELESCRQAGAAVASFHPLISISVPKAGSEQLSNANFCIEGDAEAVAAARQIAARLGAREFTIETKDKPLYHAAAVMTSGGVVALFANSIKMLESCGIETDDAIAVLYPLAASTVANLDATKPEKALTGTFARTDIETMRLHLEAITSSELTPETLELYLLLGRISLELALKNGADAAIVEKMLAEISIAKSGVRC